MMKKIAGRKCPYKVPRLLLTNSPSQSAAAVLPSNVLSSPA
jgi:hypothetical protein